MLPRAHSDLAGVRLNLNKGRLSITSSTKHAHHNVNTRGQPTESVHLPGPSSWRRTPRRGR
ncbi:DUF4236 domain-containing protein [Streptomyces flaveus]|uniref:DUF4236 domain-containing protein n=1 Tax=Streptomyces flaveus TaxID=66370 RepID=UPI0027E41736|nr:DUF4236 domain-containing protein [Streptomyces flaveus]